MSTRGCFGFRIGRHHYWVPTWHDSYPEDLGQYLVRQIAKADLDRWTQLARQLTCTRDHDKLDEAEVQHIAAWLKPRLKGGVHYNPEDATSPPGYISVREFFPDLHLSGARLLELLMPGLREHPQAFWNWFWGECEAILRLGLCPLHSGSFISSPFCEWVYLINFNTRQFVIGTGCYDLQEFLTRPNDAEVAGEIESIAAFPLDQIPDQWLSITRCNRKLLSERMRIQYEELHEYSA